MVPFLKHARAAGLRLIEAKSLVPSKGWLAWLGSVGVNQRTARRYMQLAHLSEEETASVAELGIVAALKALRAQPPRLLPGDAESDTRVIWDGLVPFDF